MENPRHLPSVEAGNQLLDVAGDDADSGCALDEFSWIPPGLTPRQVHEYFRAIPAHCIPYAGGSVGDRRRTAQLLRQLPPHDSEVRYCHGLSDEEKRELRLFSAQRRKEALGRGTVRPFDDSDAAESTCRQCDIMLCPGELIVTASRAGPNVFWHPGCFSCCVCGELLVDLIYFHGNDGRIYCGRHHAETLKPRCLACDEIIFSDECTEAEQNSWHTKHFVCCECDSALGGLRYVMHDSRPYCCGCYESQFAATCAACGVTIGVAEGHMVHGNRRWHAVDSCFRCDFCTRSLLGCPFVAAPGDEQIFCAECGVRATTDVGAARGPGSPGVGPPMPRCRSPCSPMLKQRQHSRDSPIKPTQSSGADWDFVENTESFSSRKFQQENTEPKSLCASGSSVHSYCHVPLGPDRILTNGNSVTNEFRNSQSRCFPSENPDTFNGSFLVDDPNSCVLVPETGTFGSCTDRTVDAPSGFSGNTSHECVDFPIETYAENTDESKACRSLVADALANSNHQTGPNSVDDVNINGNTEVNGHRQSRKSKNLNVRFDPSTKEGKSPASQENYRRHRSRANRTCDDIELSNSGRRLRASGYGSDSGMPSAHGRHWRENPDGNNHRACGNDWIVDDCEECSTCSSSSSDSEFDYDAYNRGSTYAPDGLSHTLPRNVGSRVVTDVTLNSVGRRARKHNKKHCIVS